MISESELNPHSYVLTPEQRENFIRLFQVINVIRRAYGRPMKVNRGVSSIEDQARIDPNHLEDAHVKGAGVDIADYTGAFWDWCMANKALIRDDLGVYLEARASTPNHVHLQIYPPKSGNWIFYP